MGRKQKKLKENNPWERSCNSEKVHLLLSMDGKHTVRWNMKKKKKIMLDIFLHGTCRLN